MKMKKSEIKNWPFLCLSTYEIGRKFPAKTTHQMRRVRDLKSDKICTFVASRTREKYQSGKKHFNEPDELTEKPQIA
jgi:hypothetical protein